MNTADPDLSARYTRNLPQVRALGIELIRVEGMEIFARMRPRPEFLCDVERGTVHTGVVTSLIDSVCGLAVFIGCGQQALAATLDLRVDYLRPTVLGADLFCRAECYRLTEQIAFARATVWQHAESEPVANSLSAFMRGNPQLRSPA